MRPVVLALLVISVSCSGPTPPPAKSTVPVKTSHQAPKDLSTKFALAGQTRMQLIPDHLLDKDFMPGGNLADYKSDVGEYQLLLLEAADAHAAAFILLDWKNAIPEAKYIAHMGGYSFMYQGKPVYIFAKGAYLAGVIGLPEEKADPEARRFAARLSVR